MPLYYCKFPGVRKKRGEKPQIKHLVQLHDIVIQMNTKLLNTLKKTRKILNLKYLNKQIKNERKNINKNKIEQLEIGN